MQSTARLHQLPSGVREMLSRTTMRASSRPIHSTQQSLVSHAIARPRISNARVVGTVQQKRSLTISQLDSGREGMELYPRIAGGESRATTTQADQFSTTRSRESRCTRLWLGRLYGCERPRSKKIPNRGRVASLLLRLYSPPRIYSSRYTRVQDSPGTPPNETNKCEIFPGLGRCSGL
jgi:hypothetical protein